MFKFSKPLYGVETRSVVLNLFTRADQ